jgi:PIN domain nuclease of toxin-antitoxin system
MKVLLDTCTFLWAAWRPELLSPAATEVFENPESEIYLSLVSVWEIVLKSTAKKLVFSETPERWIQVQRDKLRVIPLPLEEAALFQEPRLPAVHRDPFDRALVCQAITNGLTILTPDPHIHRYPVQTLW